MLSQSVSIQISWMETLYNPTVAFSMLVIAARCLYLEIGFFPHSFTSYSALCHTLLSVDASLEISFEAAS
jgi:hypothetical protein